MTRKILTVATLATFSFGISGCSFSVGTDMNTNKPANAAKPAASNSTGSNSNSASNTKADAGSKPKLANEKKPEGGSAKTAKSNPIPANWIYVYDDVKGYGFSVPEGSEGQSETIDGIDVMAVTTPAPSEIDVFVLAYKDKTRTKEDLLNDAVEFLEGLGQKVTPGALKAESDDYAVADADTVHPERGKGKLRIMVGTDVTDNYVMIIGTEASRFAANESIIDSIWGSFEMWSLD